MTHKVGVKGQVVIPKVIRDRIGIRPGDEVSFETDGDEVRIRRAEHVATAQAARIKALRGAWSEEPTGTDELLAERRKERELEESKAQRHDVGRL
jgi:antitoxin PrlF